MKLTDIPLNDAKTYKMLSEGLNLGVFQLNQGWVKGLLRSIKPSCFEDIVTLMAIIRPGAIDSGTDKQFIENRKSGNRLPDIHPELNPVLAPILDRTLGCLIFQEDVMMAISAITGWSYAEADDILTALRKKKLEKLAKSRPGFMAAGESKGFSSEALDAFWTLLEPFADYSFVRSHSVGYAVISYQTAYLKANHPKEFIAALMTHESDQAGILESIKEADRLGISVFPPDINESDLGFTPTTKGIRYGLGAIKGIGAPTVDAIMAGRPFADLTDFISRAHGNVLASGVFNALIRSGSLDSLGIRREDALVQHEFVAGLALAHRRKDAIGERTLLRPEYRIGQTRDVDWTDRAQGERDTIGLTLTNPKIILNIPKISEGDMAWLRTILGSRVGFSDVFMVHGTYRIPLGIRSSPEGLQSVISRLGIEVELV